MISHSPPIFSHSPPISFLADFINNHQNVNCNDASHYCRPQLITLASKAMVNNAQQRTTSHVFGTANSINNLMISNNSHIPLAQYLNSATSTPEMGRRLERTVTAPVLSVQPKSCLHHKSCLQKISPASIELTDKNTDTNKINEQKRVHN